MARNVIRKSLLVFQGKRLLTELVKALDFGFRQVSPVYMAKFCTCIDRNLLLQLPRCVPFLSDVLVRRCSSHDCLVHVFCHIKDKSSGAQELHAYYDVPQL